jgi:hypothetical protein
MRKVLIAGVAAAALTTVASGAVLPYQAKNRDVSVTVAYTGKGAVDDKHQILVFLFDHPAPTAASEPLGVRSTPKSGGTVTFSDVAANPVYVILVYDEKSNYDGKSGPPPAGTPISTYSKGGKPVPVTPGPAAKVKTSFDDSQRWK